MRFPCSVALVAALLSFAPLAAQTASPVVAPPATSSGVVLRPGDAVAITVFRQPELSGEFSIGAAGTVDHPLYQRVSVTGVPMDSVHARLRTFLLDWEADPQLHVKALFQVGVGGAVLRPNLYPLAPETTISQAVAAAGGVTERGRLNRVRVLRHGEEFYVDLTDVESPLMAETVRSGDQIIVEQRAAVVFRDYVAPAGTILVGIVSLANLIFR